RRPSLGMSGRMSPLSLGMAPWPVLMLRLLGGLSYYLTSHAEGGRLPGRIVGGVQTVAHAAQHLPCRRLAPEPARDIRAGDVRPGEQAALPVERLQIVGRPADEGGERHIGRAPAHVAVTAGGEALQSVDDLGEAVDRNPAETEDGAAVVVGEPPR